MTKDLLQLLHPYIDEFVALRHDLHQHPELGFEEHRTSEIVAKLLEGWGYRVERGLAATGVIARLQRGTGSRRLGLRADMDALPVEETSEHAHRSRNEGYMHACGHDGHTVMLLAAARYLAEHGHFSGTLNLIFQPAEEGLGGALRMIEEGLFEHYPCDAIFAMHNLPGYPQGQLLFCEGPTMASSDYVTITLHSPGGHGAMPQQTTDPIVAAASIIMALQTVVARNIDPRQPAVVTVGAINAGHLGNIIPQTATLKLSVRALDNAVRDLLEQRIRALVGAQAESFGVQVEIDYRRGYPVLVNSPAETVLAREAGIELAGADKVIAQAAPLTCSEDFAYMLERCPGSYLFIGNGDGHEGRDCPLHAPDYDFDDRNLLTGAAYWVHLTERFLDANVPG